MLSSPRDAHFQDYQRLYTVKPAKAISTPEIKEIKTSLECIYCGCLLVEIPSSLKSQKLLKCPRCKKRMNQLCDPSPDKDFSVQTNFCEEYL